MLKGKRIKNLYSKYIERSCTDSELEELFELLKEPGTIEYVREVLHENWMDEAGLEELYPLSWENFLEKKGLQTASEPNRTISKRKWMVPLSVAAGFLLILGFVGWYWLNQEKIISYETGYGELLEVMLDDGSRVQLNANSRIYWDKNWRGKGRRNIRIEGEAFFDVAHFDDRPFFVKTSDLIVHVTGTTFNVSKRRDATKVFLESGNVSVQLFAEDKKIHEDGFVESTGERVLELRPGDQLQYSSNRDEMRRDVNLDISQAASWKSGELVFRNVPFNSVLQELSDVYGKKFEVPDSNLIQKKIDVGMPFSDWETVKKVLQLMTKTEITETNDHVIIR